MPESGLVAADNGRQLSSAPATVPYPSSALNRLFIAIERLPFGGWWVYLLLLVVLVAYYEVSLWVLGVTAVGSISVDGLTTLVYGPYIIAATHYLTNQAGHSMDAFRPASGLNDAEFAERRYELVTLPANRVWLPVLLGAIVGVAAFLPSTSEVLAPFGGTVRNALIVSGPSLILGYGFLGVAIYQTLRQLLRVERLHRDATAIDLYDTAPIYAFSRLTVQIGLTFAIAGYYALAVNGTFQAGNGVALAAVGASIAVGVACFIVPLWGIHGRLQANKAALLRGVNLRAQALQADLYARVDSSNLAGVKDVTDALNGINVTRELVAKLPTWPWPPQLLRGFITALLLPILVYLITRYVGQVALL
jgi:hypothetical protein